MAHTDSLPSDRTRLMIELAPLRSLLSGKLRWPISDNWPVHHDLSSHLSAFRLTRRYRSHTPGSPPPPHSPVRSRSRRRSSPTPHPNRASAQKTTAGASPASARSTPLPLPHPPAYSPASRVETPDPAADRPLQP